MAYYKRRVENDNNGKIVYNVGIVKGIVRLAVEGVEGVAISNKRKSLKAHADDIKVETIGDAISVKVSVNVYYGYSVSDVAYHIQENIKHNVESMSKYKIGGIDVKVNGVIFPEDGE